MAGIWSDTDWTLGVIELVVLAPSLVWLIWAHAGRRRSRRWATLVCVGLAVTVAQPFGIHATRISAEQFGSPRQAERRSAHQPHTLAVLGVPLFGFRLYVRDYIRLGVEESGSATGELKVRSWLWPVLMTNAEAIDPMCEGAAAPCWNGRQSTAQNLQLYRAGDRWRVLILRPDGTRVAGADAASVGGYYDLRLGIVSLIGVVYWGVLVLCAITALLIRRDIARERLTSKG